MLIVHVDKATKFWSSDVLSQITYVTVGKETYLLEVPESMGSCVPRDYELRSSKKVSRKN